MSKEIEEEIEKAKSVYSGYGSSERYEKLLFHLDQVLALWKQHLSAYETRTIENTEVCPCGNVFVEEDDYDTLGSESGVCCPSCGNEKFQTVKDLLKQQPKAGEKRTEYLNCYGYADGSYSNNCHTCKKEFVGDRRAINCKECATDMSLTGALMVLDRAEASKAEQLKACERGYQRLLELGQGESTQTVKIMKAVIAKAEQGGE